MNEIMGIRDGTNLPEPNFDYPERNLRLVSAKHLLGNRGRTSDSIDSHHERKEDSGQNNGYDQTPPTVSDKSYKDVGHVTLE